MKSYYLFALESSTITRATTFYKVAIGRSQCDQQILAQIQKKIENCSDALFAIYSSELADFLCRVANSLGYDSFCHFAAAQLRHIDATELRKQLTSRDSRSLLPRRRRSTSANPLTK